MNTHEPADTGGGKKDPDSTHTADAPPNVEKRREPFAESAAGEEDPGASVDLLDQDRDATVPVPVDSTADKPKA